MLGIVAVGVVRESRKFSGHRCIGRIARHLCDSTAFLLTVKSVRNYNLNVKLCVRVHREIQREFITAIFLGMEIPGGPVVYLAVGRC